MSLLLYKLGLRCARHPILVVGVWAVLVLGLVVFSRIAGDRTSDDLSLPGTDSTSATDLLDQRLPDQANGTVPMVFYSDSGKLTDSKNSAAINQTVSALRGVRHVRSVVSPLSDEGADALSSNERTGFASLNLNVGPSDLDTDEADAIIAAGDPARDAGLEVSEGGYLGQEVSRPSTHSSEAIGLAAAVIVLSLAFGTAVAMSLPILSAVIGLLGSLAIVGLLGHVTEVPTISETLGTMIGLGVGIDYSLFIVTRYRSRVADGLDRVDAIARSCATSGSAVAFAGGTVVIALCSLALARIPIVTTLGYTAAIVVLIAVTAALTLLPAILSLLGARIESLRLPFGQQAHHDDRPHGWARWAEAVAKRPWPALVVAVALLVLLALPLRDMTLGQQDVGQLPEDTTARQAYERLTDGFGPGQNGPLLIAVALDPPAHPDNQDLNALKAQQAQQQQEAQAQAVETGVPPAPPSQAQQEKTDQQETFLSSTASDPRLQKLEKKVGKDPGIASTSQAAVADDGRGAVFTAIATTAPSDLATEDTVRRLRDDVVPTAEGNDVRADLGGTTAAYIDLADRISDHLVSVILIVVGLSFVLLLIAFRSILIPITAALMNLLSVAAAYGVLVGVFEKGWGLSLIGLEDTVPIVSFVPLLMFAVLFGLSMDYQVFLVSRIGEVWRDSADNREAVVHGLASSARVITSAALIMVAVFGSFILNGDPTVKQFGVGLAVAIAVDATIVRCLLVPAAMVLMGKANWWFPAWLDRIIPRVGLETEDTLPKLAADTPAAQSP